MSRKKSRILERIHFKEFALATTHRAENVDNPAVLKNFVEAFAKAPIPIVYTLHPRTEKRLKQSGIYSRIKKAKNIQVLPPIGYLDFLTLIKKCKLILTDSGGIQEEATAPQIRKPVLVLRLSTERLEAVEAGFARVVVVRKENIINAIREVLNGYVELPLHSPYGNGKAAEKIAEIIKNKILT
ncbi:MAG: UDP-N-acetylglucosamine 2-epimerase [Candidatus Bathyarchaeia archaeon]